MSICPWSVVRCQWPRTTDKRQMASAVFVFTQQLAEARVVPDGIKVAVLAHVAEIAVAQLDGPAKGLDRLVGALEQGVAARQVVMSQGIVGAELNQPLVDLQALRIAPLEGEVVAVGAEGIDVARKAFQNAAVKIELEIQLAL